MADAHRLQQRLADLRYGQHVCYFYDQPAEALDVAARAIVHGLTTGASCLYVTGEFSLDEVITSLTAGGVDVLREQQRRALTLRPAHDVVFSPGQFDPRSIVALYDDMVDQAIARGFTGLWIVAD